MFSIPALNTQCLADIHHRIDTKTKPPGSLGLLEALAARIAQIQWQGAVGNIEINRPTLLVFAADHGIATHSVSIAPQAVTRQMVLNFLDGGAAINCFCRTSGMELMVVDAGMIEALESSSERLMQRRVGAGTADFSVQAAMTHKEYQKALISGAALAQQLTLSGCNLLAFGEMGIGNTSSASALLALLNDCSAADVAGRGTGITDEQLGLKRRLIDSALERVRSTYTDLSDASILLREVGGFEIVQMVGAMLAAAEHRSVLLIDGFIVSVAALMASRINPRVVDYMVFAHRSAEAAHQDVLQQLNAEPLLDIGLRLGEGTGAALALPLVQACCEYYNNMASFESANIVVELDEEEETKALSEEVERG